VRKLLIASSVVAIGGAVAMLIRKQRKRHELDEVDEENKS